VKDIMPPGCLIVFAGFLERTTGLGTATILLNNFGGIVCINQV
jgi:hypothetical protein